jgi:dihydroorotate dehydrogenase
LPHRLTEAKTLDFQSEVKRVSLILDVKGVEVDFGCVGNAAGARNFFLQEGWRQTHWLEPWPLNWDGSTFFSNTFGMYENAGHLDLRTDRQSNKLFPPCIKTYFWKEVVLNAKALSCPPAVTLVAKGLWQKLTKPFFLNVAALGRSRKERCDGVGELAELLRSYKFSAPYGIEWNVDCPNVDHNGDPLEELPEYLERFNEIHRGIPHVVKLAPTRTYQEGLALAENPNVAAITFANSAHFGVLPDRIDWKGIFGTDVSPLASFGGGSLSGWPLNPIVAHWIFMFRHYNQTFPLIACGGLRFGADAVRLLICGANMVQIGSTAMLRPWRVQPIIRDANSFRA